MDEIIVNAVYEGGILKLEQPLPLPENQRVRVTVRVRPTRAERLQGLIQWTGSQEDLDYLINDEENSCWEEA